MTRETTRKYPEAFHAVQYARREAKRSTSGIDWQGFCLKFVRTCWNLNAKFPTAAKAWEGSKDKHSWTGDTEDIPFGAPVFSYRPDAGPNDAGHVFIAGGHSEDGKRIFRSTDIKRLGSIDCVPIEAFTERWGHKILGWTGDLNGVSLNLPPSPNERKAAKKKTVKGKPRK